MTQIIGTTLGASIGGGGGGVGGGNSFPEIEQTVFVDKGAITGAEDGSQQNPFHTVEAGIAAAVALLPAADNQIAVYIYPGLYVENNDLTLPDYVHLVGMCRDACIIQRTNVAAPADAALDVTGPNTSIWNLTFENTEDARVVFWDTGGGAVSLAVECRFHSPNGGADNNTRVGGDSSVWVEDCIFDNDDITDEVLRVATTEELWLVNCEVLGFVRRSTGDFYAYRSSFLSDNGAYTIRILATDIVFLQSCVVENSGAGPAFLFEANPTSTSLLGNRLLVDSSTKDINATTDVTGVELQGNAMSKGIERDIIPNSLERWCKGQPGDLDYYVNLTEAMKAVEQDGVVIRMLDDEVFGASFVVPGYEYTIDLRGHKISRASRALIISVSSAGTDLTIIDGEVEGAIAISVANNLTLKRVRLDGKISCVAGSTGTVLLDRCHAEPEDNSADTIRLLSTDIKVLIRRSFVKGETGTNNGAIAWRADNDNVSAKYTTFSNGDGVNDPFERNAAQTPTARFYQCGFNAAIPVWITNAIAVGQEQNSVDTDTDFP